MRQAGLEDLPRFVEPMLPISARRRRPTIACLFDVGFPLSGSRTGLTPPISTPVPSTPGSCHHLTNTALQPPVERTWPDRLELQSATFEYIEAFYSRHGRHPTLQMLSPANYEQLRLSPVGC